jgi:hypothetical protein
MHAMMLRIMSFMLALLIIENMSDKEILSLSRIPFRKKGVKPTGKMASTHAPAPSPEAPQTLEITFVIFARNLGHFRLLDFLKWLNKKGNNEQSSLMNHYILIFIVEMVN